MSGVRDADGRVGLDELRELACRVAVVAGERVRDLRRAGVHVAATKSTSTDVVTHADTESERLIRSLLAEARPNDGFLGEEGSAEQGSSGLTWVVDPIDGTVNYLYDIPAYAVSVGVVEGDPDPATWSALAGCVVNPVVGEVYSAAAGRGASLGDRPLHVTTGTDLTHALVASGFSYSAQERTAQAEAIARLIGSVRDIRRIGAASLDLCAVAAGRLDAYFERGLKPWDHAAGGLIAREAGARVTGWGDAPAGSDFILAAEPRLAERLERVLAQILG